MSEKTLRKKREEDAGLFAIKIPYRGLLLAVLMCLCFAIPAAAETSGPCHVKCDMQVIVHHVTVQPITVQEVAALQPNIELAMMGRDYSSRQKAGHLSKPLTSTDQTSMASEVAAIPAHIAVLAMGQDNFYGTMELASSAYQGVGFMPSSTTSFETST